MDRGQSQSVGSHALVFHKADDSRFGLIGSEAIMAQTKVENTGEDATHGEEEDPDYLAAA